MPSFSTLEPLAFIGDIYDSALDPCHWRSTLHRLNEAMNGAYTAISVVDPRLHQLRFISHSPWDSLMISQLQTGFGPMELPNAHEIMNGDLDTPLSTIETMGEAAFQETRFYREWAAPQGLRDGCSMKFVSLPERLSVISFVTPRDRPPIGADERDFMRLLGPHLRRAALIGDLLDYARVETSLLRAALAPLRVPVVLASADARIMHANDAAEQLLDVGAVIASVEGRLVLGNDRMTAALSDAVARAAAGGVELGNRGIGIPASLPGQQPAVVYVLPLASRLDHGRAIDGMAAVFVAAPHVAMAPAEDMLTTMFDLSPAEARVMVQIASGRTVLAAAYELGVSENTIKTQLARVFAKTHTSRQGELAELFRSLASPLAGEAPPLPGKS